MSDDSEIPKLVDLVLTAMRGFVRRSLQSVADDVARVRGRVESLFPEGATRDSLKGERGEKGDTGDRGPAGEPGAVGGKGDKGDRGEDGASLEPDIVKGMIERAVAALPRPVQAIDAAEMKALVDACVADAALALRKDVELADTNIAAEIAKQVAALPPPAAGRDAFELDIHEQIVALKRYHRGEYASHQGGVWKAVRPTDPLAPGADPYAAGWTCVLCGVDEIAVDHTEDLRKFGIAVKLTDGRVVEKTIAQPVLIDRGTFDREKVYEAGDGVTWDGSLWIAQRITRNGEVPGDGSDSFRMAVKRGRDGLKGDRGDRGAPGRDGKP